MGSYGISRKEIVQTLAEALDGIEGDFTKHELLMAIIKLKNYPYVSDSELIIDDTDWKNYLNEDANCTKDEEVKE